MKKYLFIGGPVNGKRLATNGQQQAGVRIPEQIQFAPTEKVCPEEYAFWHYTLRSWPCGNKFVPVYVLEGLSDLDAMRLLFNGYKP